jgi:hypothetical protein
MSKFIKYDSILTEVTAFSGNFDNRVLYGKPEFTAGNTYTTLTCGFSGSRTFEGYNFDSIQGVMLSTFGNEDLAGLLQAGTHALTAVSALSYLSGGATIEPPLTGFFITSGTSSGTYTLNNYNSMTVTFPTISTFGTSGYGVINVIPINAAGFAIWSTNIKFTTQSVTDHSNQIYVSYE